VPVDVYPVEGISGVALTELLVPNQAAPGQLVEAVSVVEAGVAGSVTLHPVVGGVELAPIELDVVPGLNAAPFSFRFVEGAVVGVCVSLVAIPPKAGAARLATEIGPRVRPPLLVLDDPAVAAALEVQG